MIDLPQKLGALLSGVAFFLALTVGLFDQVKLHIVICRAVTLFFIFLMIGWGLGLLIVSFFMPNNEHEEEQQQRIQIDIGSGEESESLGEKSSDTLTQSKVDGDDDSNI